MGEWPSLTAGGYGRTSSTVGSASPGQVGLDYVSRAAEQARVKQANQQHAAMVSVLAGFQC